MRDVLPQIEQWRAAGKGVATATVVSVVGSAPRAIGATLAVSEDGEIAGSVSGGCVEPAVIEDELRSLRSGKPKLLQFGITEEQNVEQIGLSCGGEIRVFVQRVDAGDDVLLDALSRQIPSVAATVISAPDGYERLIGAHVVVVEGERASGGTGIAELDATIGEMAGERLLTGRSETRPVSLPDGQTCEVYFGVYPPPPTLIIVGAGHVTLPLTRIAKVLDYQVVVVDPREAFATPERLRAADQVLVEWPDEALAHLPLTSATAVAVLTHDDKFDVPALRVALSKPVSYVGAIGSRGTKERRDERLREAGVTDEQIARIHGPIGLDLGARTPEEIALAIMAEIVATRNSRRPLTKPKSEQTASTAR